MLAASGAAKWHSRRLPNLIVRISCNITGPADCRS